MIICRVVPVTDPLARANVVAALSGAGAPMGILRCVATAGSVVVEFDAARTAEELVDALIAVEVRYVAARHAGDADSAAIIASAARGLREPALDRTRIIETYLP